MYSILALIYIGWLYDWRLALAAGVIILCETRFIHRQIESLEVLMRKLAYDPPFKNMNQITTNQYHSLTQEQKDAHQEYWHQHNPGCAWSSCPGCGFPTHRGMMCGHLSCGKK